MLTNRLDKMCYVRADSRARYEKIVDVVNNLRAAGVDQLGLLTEQMQQKKTPGALRRPGSKAEYSAGTEKESFIWQWQ